ncbi:hypothetical protein K466DRAFT_604328 [Polyporus arcularius HHB13444]|uniref:HAD-like protein n=1 Tax=Polyporus arcularius HHB13444 TaxID=1314778 RepID=A0A5C3P7A5_9APHY|nr:hypothetical protein K466DRAFT_604328 [Polyporus arcularius HHB13444]
MRKIEHQVSSGHRDILHELTAVKTQIHALQAAVISSSGAAAAASPLSYGAPIRQQHACPPSEVQYQQHNPLPVRAPATTFAPELLELAPLQPPPPPPREDDPRASLSTSAAISGLPDATIPPQNLMIFDLDGETLRFDKTEVPNPPKADFAHDISRLFREWHSSSLLVISGRGIPIKHWERFYKKRSGIKTHAWKSIRALWGNWKFIVTEREQFASEDAFWAKYSEENGKRMNYQKILDILQDRRKADAKRDAAAALRFFNNDLGQPRAKGYFHYTRTGVDMVCTDMYAIASKWRQLLSEHPDIAQEWELSRGDDDFGG